MAIFARVDYLAGPAAASREKRGRLHTFCSRAPSMEAGCALKARYGQSVSRSAQVPNTILG
jgi:hypothetical protein